MPLVSVCVHNRVVFVGHKILFVGSSLKLTYLAFYRSPLKDLGRREGRERRLHLSLVSTVQRQ